MHPKTNIQRYPAYKDSGVEWLGEVPAHWEVLRIRNSCEMLVSNVDKHSKPLERQVKLCNYVDVYKNEFITADINFMEATATADEIRRFKINLGDVIITKDSEDWLDIGVPALVKHEEENLVCGYHLAILRPKRNITGGFLHRVLLSQSSRTQFSVKANGVTRYGISHGAILGTFIPIPTLPEQTRIAAFLDRKTAQIDQAIAQKERLIELLKERRQIIIQNAVTRGLDPNVRMKDSGVEWIGEVPEHWEVRRLKHVCDINRNTLPETTNKSFELEYVDIGSVTFENGISQTEKFTFKDAPSRARRLAKTGDTIISTVRTYLKAIDFVDEQKSNYVYSTGFAVLNPIKINSKFLSTIVKSDSFTNQVDAYSKGMSYPAINSTDLGRLQILIPPLPEQTRIAAFLDRKTAQIATAITAKQAEIEKLKELKSVLIDSAVTGKIRV